MIDLNGKKIVDLTVELIARVTRLDGTIEEGTTDHYGHGWPSEETINEQDGTMEQLVGANQGTVSVIGPLERSAVIWDRIFSWA